MMHAGVQIITEPTPSPLQIAAWRWLWAKLLAPENSNAPADEAEASHSDPDGRPNRKELCGQPHSATNPPP